MSCGLSALSIAVVSISWGQLILGRTLIGAHGCLAQFMGPYWLWHDIWGHGEYRPIGHHHIKQLEVTLKIPPRKLRGRFFLENIMRNVNVIIIIIVNIIVIREGCRKKKPYFLWSFYG